MDDTCAGGQRHCAARISFAYPDGTVRDCTRRHRRIRFTLPFTRREPDVNAIVHAHPGALVSFSICGQVPDTRLFPEAWNVCGKVAFARYAVPGSRRWVHASQRSFPRSTTELRRFRKPRGRRWRRIWPQHSNASRLSSSLRRQFSMPGILDRSVTSPTSRSVPRRQRDATCYQKASLDQTSRDKELRKEMCDFVHRAYEHRS